MKRRLLISVLAVGLVMQSTWASPMLHDKGMKRMFAGLELTQTQRQDIKQIMRQLGEDNSVYRGEKQSIQQQMQALMQMDTWDEQKAEELIRQSIASKHALAANRAQAKHQAYQVLTDTQKQQFDRRMAKIDERRERDRDSELFLDKAQDKLSLSPQQVAQIETILDQQQAALEEYQQGLKTHREQARQLIFASGFDKDAFATLNASFTEHLVDIGLIRAKTRFDMMQVLTEEQQQKLPSRSPYKAKGQNPRFG